MSKAMGLDLAETDFETGGDFYLYPTVYAGPMTNKVIIIKLIRRCSLSGRA